MTEEKNTTTMLDIHEYPQTIKRKTLELRDISKELPEAHLRVKCEEDRIRAEVKDLYSNDKQRDAACRQLMQQDPDYQMVYVAEVNLRDEHAKLEAELEMLRSEFKLALVAYEAEMLGARQPPVLVLSHSQTVDFFMNSPEAEVALIRAIERNAFQIKEALKPPYEK